MSEWISVKEKLPEYGKHVLVVCNGKVQWHSAVLLSGSKEWFFNDEWDDAPFEAVTHWMPLPAPPMTSEAKSAENSNERKP